MHVTTKLRAAGILPLNEALSPGQENRLWRAHLHGGVMPSEGFSREVLLEKAKILQGLDQETENEHPKEFIENKKIFFRYKFGFRNANGDLKLIPKKLLDSLRKKAKALGVWLQPDAAWLMDSTRMFAGNHPNDPGRESLTELSGRPPTDQEYKEMSIYGTLGEPSTLVELEGRGLLERHIVELERLNTNTPEF